MFKKFFDEYREFIQRGNVIDLAIGVIMGSAFGKITSSLVQDIIMPPIGFILGGIEFSELSISMQPLDGKAAVTIDYGKFIQTVVDFLIIGFVVFLIVKAVNAFKRKQQQDIAAMPAAPPKPSTQEQLLMEIRDLLKSQAKS